MFQILINLQNSIYWWFTFEYIVKIINYKKIINALSTKLQIRNFDR